VLVTSVALLALATAAPTAGALRVGATEAYRAKRYAEACRKFGEAARLEPGNAALAADSGLCLHRLGKTDEAIAETRRAIRLAKDGPDARRVRRSAYYNLSVMAVALGVPYPGSCGPLELAPGCDRPVHACGYSWEISGTGGSSGGEWLNVALDAAAANVAGAQADGRERPDARDPRYDDPEDEGSPTENAAVILLEEEESFGNVLCEPSDSDWKGCTLTDEAKMAATRCVARKGCTGKPEVCRAWDECVSTYCEKALGRREEECRRRNLPRSSEFRCKIVYADGCTGVVGSACEKYAPERPGPVHEVRLRARAR
jgi:hypothetical protein